MKRLADFFTSNNYLLQEELENICGLSGPKQQKYIYFLSQALKTTLGVKPITS